MKITWPTGYNAYYRELGYFSGTKIAPNFDASPLGGANDLSLATLWKTDDVLGAALVNPDAGHTPATFSTCVMITR
jgi:hypothetical protein